MLRQLDVVWRRLTTFRCKVLAELFCKGADARRASAVHGRCGRLLREGRSAERRVVVVAFLILVITNGGRYKVTNKQARPFWLFRGRTVVNQTAIFGTWGSVEASRTGSITISWRVLFRVSIARERRNSQNSSQSSHRQLIVVGSAL